MGCGLQNITKKHIKYLNKTFTTIETHININVSCETFLTLDNRARNRCQIMFVTAGQQQAY